MTIHPAPVALAIEYLAASGERTEERLNSLTDHFCEAYAFPVTDGHRTAAAEECKRRFYDFKSA